MLGLKNSIHATVEVTPPSANFERVHFHTSVHVHTRFQ
jgi:hypothetical protein